MHERRYVFQWQSLDLVSEYDFELILLLTETHCSLLTGSPHDHLIVPSHHSYQGLHL